MDDPHDLAEQIVNSEAYTLQQRVASIASTYRILDSNFIRLRSLLEAFRDAEPRNPIWNIDRRYEINAAAQEAIRLLHNFLSSTKTFVDLLRVIIHRHYEDSELLGEYQQEINRRFIGDPLTQFVHGLRNYMLHFSLPVTSAEMEIRADEVEGGFTITSRFILDVSALAEWDSWNDAAREYLEAQESDLDILLFSAEYHSKIEQFHVWIQRRIAEEHSTEFRWLEEMQSRLGELSN